LGNGRPAHPRLIADQRAPTRVRVLIVDDHHLIRAGLSHVLAGVDDLVVVGEASSGRTAIAEWQRTHAQLIVMDTEMPDIDGIEATRIIKRRDPSVVVVCASTSEEPDRLLDALRAGATGFVLKDTGGDELVSILRHASRGEAAIAPALASRLLVRLAMEARVEPDMPEPLTGRELEVLELVAAGNTNREIASSLIVAVGTVKVHVEHILQKLGVSDRTEAAVRAVELGLVHPHRPPDRGPDRAARVVEGFG
jgi:DNA-binding NarL/FixJ family response regulator